MTIMYIVFSWYEKNRFGSHMNINACTEDLINNIIEQCIPGDHLEMLYNPVKLCVLRYLLGNLL